MDVGLKFEVDPIPPILENTKMFKAGAIAFGVEYRVLNDQVVDESYGADLAQLVQKTPGFVMPERIDDSGVSIHVFGEDEREYLRFDCFVEDPHYHYVMPDETYQRVVAFDTVANGDPLTWTLACLRTRLNPMLREAGGSRCADRLDSALVTAALDRVEEAARAVVDRNSVVA
jgi:hypothetical protein